MLFQVTDRKGWDPKQYAANRDQTRTTLLQQRVSSVEGALIEKRRRDLNVTFDQQFLDQLGIAPPSDRRTRPGAVLRGRPVLQSSP